MEGTGVFCREAGTGPAVICFHSNASVSGQWKALFDTLSDRFSMFAPDAYGAGRSPEWPSDRNLTLADEADLVEPVLESAGERFALVGHSYGGAIALKIAALMPQRVTAIALYEPTLFSLIDAEGPSPNDADGIRHAAAAAATAFANGDPESAAETFIDYWMGTGSWARTPAERKPAIAASIANVHQWAHALFTEPTPLSTFAALNVPVLCMTGARSTVSAHGVARRLLSALPQATHVEFPELGHMGPITHPGVVNAAIGDFLDETVGGTS